MVAGAQVEAGHLGQAGWEEARLEGPGQLQRALAVLLRLASGETLAVVEAGPLERHRRLLGHGHEKATLAILDRKVVLEAHGEHSDHPFLGGQRDRGRAAVAGAGEGREVATGPVSSQPTDPDRLARAGRLRRREVGVEGDDHGVAAGRLGKGEAQAAALVVEQPQAPAAHRPLGDGLVPDHPHHLVDGEGPGQVSGEDLEPAETLAPMEAVDGEGAQLGDGHQKGLLVGVEPVGFGEAETEHAEAAFVDHQGEGDEALVEHGDGRRPGVGLDAGRAGGEEDGLAPPGGVGQRQAGVDGHATPRPGELVVAERPPHDEAVVVP